MLLACSLYLLVVFLLLGKDKPRETWIDVIIAVVGLVAGMVILGIVWSNPALAWFKPRRFVDRVVWVMGASPKFLASLPTTNQDE